MKIEDCAIILDEIYDFLRQLPDVKSGLPESVSIQLNFKDSVVTNTFTTFEFKDTI